MDHKETREILLLLGQNDINENAIFTPADCRDFVFIRTKWHSSNGHVYINAYLSLSSSRIKLLTLGTACTNKNRCRTSAHCIIKYTSYCYRKFTFYRIIRRRIYWPYEDKNSDINTYVIITIYSYRHTLVIIHAWLMTQCSYSNQQQTQAHFHYSAICTYSNGI